MVDGLIGAGTGGLLHGAGKLASEASPFVKQAFNKISTELSENARIAKIALSNMEKGPKPVVLGSNLGNVDEALRRFGEEFKKAKTTIIKEAGEGKYTTKIKWGINDIEARPFGKGFFGKRISQKNTRVDNFELKINPNNESFYLPHPKGGYVQFENLIGDILQDGKLIVKQKSFYYVEDLPEFAQNKVVQEAMRQIESAKEAGYKVEWLVSDEKAIVQLTRLFERKNIDITVRYYPE